MAITSGLLVLGAFANLAAPRPILQDRNVDSLIPHPLTHGESALIGVRDALPIANLAADPDTEVQVTAAHLDSRDASPMVDAVSEIEDVEKRATTKTKKGKNRVANTNNELPPGVSPLVMLTGGSRPLEEGNQPHVARRQVPPKPLVLLTGGSRPLKPGNQPHVASRDVAPPSPQSILATFVPSAGAAGIPITEQSQLVTTYSPTTVCNTAALASPTDAPCTTTLVPQETHICATQIEQLAAPAISVTDCQQLVTYSTKYGYTQIEATQTQDSPGCASSEIATQTTYYAAIWSDVLGSQPTGGIEIAPGPDGSLTTATWSTAAVVTPPPAPIDPVIATTSIFVTKTTTVYSPELRT